MTCAVTVGSAAGLHAGHLAQLGVLLLELAERAPSVLLLSSSSTAQPAVLLLHVAVAEHAVPASATGLKTVSPAERSGENTAANAAAHGLERAGARAGRAPAG